jgi:hypothetical protein
VADESKEVPSDYQLIGPSDDGQINDLLATLNARDSRQRLQALIAEWLRMENLVVLAGAETSVTSVACAAWYTPKIERRRQCPSRPIAENF